MAAGDDPGRPGVGRPVLERPAGDGDEAVVRERVADQRVVGVQADGAGPGLLVRAGHRPEQEPAPDHALGGGARQRVQGDLLEQAVAQQQPVRRERVVGEHLALHDLAQLVGHRLGDRPLDDGVADLVQLGGVALETEAAQAVPEVRVLDRAGRQVVVQPGDHPQRGLVAVQRALHPHGVGAMAVDELAPRPLGRLGIRRAYTVWDDRQHGLVVAAHSDVGVRRARRARRRPSRRRCGSATRPRRRPGRATAARR